MRKNGLNIRVNVAVGGAASMMFSFGRQDVSCTCIVCCKVKSMNTRPVHAKIRRLYALALVMNKRCVHSKSQIDAGKVLLLLR